MLSRSVPVSHSSTSHRGPPVGVQPTVQAPPRTVASAVYQGRAAGPALGSSNTGRSLVMVVVSPLG